MFLVCVLLSDEVAEINDLASSSYLAVIALASWTLVVESSAPTWLWAFAIPAPLLALPSLAALSLLPSVREFGAPPTARGVLAALLALVICLMPVFLIKAVQMLTAFKKIAYSKFSDNEIDL